jgi:hypothetical protein
MLFYLYYRAIILYLPGNDGRCPNPLWFIVIYYIQNNQ